ncbi:MAG TPA: TIGR03663 family protein [Oligoflexia bacterium]|nr:TIGR03663 family protein [Oligoflexia bacterium]HMR24472.1 TIGR03663 family protein [Oligoflexia bacterium]
MLKEIITQIKTRKLVGIFIAAIFLFLCFTRLYQLGDKPYHHDESLYAKYSYDYATQNFYRFDPILHGPMLFTIQALCFKIFGDTDFTGRLTSAISGILLVYLCSFLLFLIFKNLNPVLSFVTLTALSPTLTYFSRFLGMDMLLCLLFTASLLSLYQFLYSKKSFYLFNSLIFLSFMVCTKLNYLFYFFFLVTFLMVLFFFKRSRYTYITQAVKDYFVRYKYLKITLLFITPVLIFSLLYSGFGQHWPGVLDGLYRKMLPYWINQHKIQRIRGPFDYYLPLLVQYELPIVLAIIFYLIKILRSSKNYLRQSLYVAVLSFAAFIVVKAFWINTFSSLLSIFHFSRPYHFLILIFYIFAGVRMTLYHLKHNEYFHAFSIFWFWVSLSLYSYAGEKVPWLLVHVIFPAFLYLAPQLSKTVQASLSHTLHKRILGLGLVILISWQLINVYRTNFIFNARPKNLLAFTHTSWETKQMAHKLLTCKKVYPNMKIETLNAAAAIWPLSWYLRHYHGWYTINKNPSLDSLIFIQDWDRQSSIEHPQLNQYTPYRYKLREWMVPDQTLSSLSAYLQYILFWQAKDPEGSMDSIVYVHPNALDCWINNDHYQL